MEPTRVANQLAEVAFRIKEMRQICGFTQAEVAKKTDTTLAEDTTYGAGLADPAALAGRRVRPGVPADFAAVCAGKRRKPWGHRRTACGNGCSVAGRRYPCGADSTAAKEPKEPEAPLKERVKMVT